MLIEMVADIVCPWCYVGWRRLQRALAQRPGIAPQIAWRAFQLNPDMPAIGMSRTAYMIQKFGPGAASMRLMDNVAAAGTAAGIEFRFDRIERMPNSLEAHRLIGFAARRGRQAEMIERLFAEYFTAGRDLGSRAVLLDAAREIGFDTVEVARHLTSRDGVDTILAEDRAARRLGIGGVPCFVIGGRYALSGAQEPEFFLPLFDLAQSELHEAIAVA